MRILFGLILVFASVIAGYCLERGELAVLLQPAELIIIGGATIGTVLISNSRRNLAKLGRALVSLWRHQTYDQSFYFELLRLLYVVLAYTRRSGFPALEDHVDDPEGSPIFSANPVLSADLEARTFLLDSLRMIISAGLGADETDRLMQVDIDVQRAGRQQPVTALLNVADSLPGLGIVAAVLGVVVTMQALGGGTAEVGQKVAAALVGTFLGILLCYGVVGPLGTFIQQLNRSRLEVLHVIRVGVVNFMRGVSPLVAVEFARRAVPLELRPGFALIEEELRRNTSIPAAPAQGAPATETQNA